MDKSILSYTPLFCEENIWKLIGHLQGNCNIIAQDVLFIINPLGHIALFEQAVNSDDFPAIWDYHVILSAETDNGPVIFDFDSRLPFPVNLQTYFSNTFRHWLELPEAYRPYLRVIETQYYYKKFYSDRSHMTGLIENDEFPDYPVIAPTDKHNILTLDACRFVADKTDFETLVNPQAYSDKFKK